MAKIRYNILVMTSSRGVRKQDFIFNRQPVRPGSVADTLNEVVADQYSHIGFGLRSNGLTKYIVHGIRLRGAGLDGTDIVWMWNPVTKAAVVVKAVRA
jgi:hypothetical protein